jgi:serine/threonine protein kinase
MKRCPSCEATFPTDYTLCSRDGKPLVEVGEWAEGTLVHGKYRILAKVGQGGMASVYKAMHARFKEIRALKVISPELASDANFVRRFEQEAIITRRLQHPNAVRVDDIDEAEDGRPFIVMEYVEGRSLRDVIEQGAPLSVARVCSIVAQVAAALDAAHRLGLVHRDIKPANIALVGPGSMPDPSSDYVKVLDFGIAKLKEAHLADSKVRHETMTGTGMVIGTPAYMSPEQARGLKGEQLDGRSDLYSLGVVAYQMLTGDLPLKADSTLELLMAHISTTPKPVQEVRPDLRIPAAVADVVMRCLEKNRELRPASGQALTEEIELAADRGQGRRPMTMPTTARKPVTSTRARVLRATPGARKSGALHSRVWFRTVAAALIAGALAGTWYLLATKRLAEQGKPRVAATGAENKSVALPSAESSVPAPERHPTAKTRPPEPLLATPLRHETAMTSTIGDLGVQSGLIAYTRDALEILRQKGDRNYYEFTLLTGAQPQLVATVSLQIRNVDVAHGKFTMNVTSDDKTIEKKDRNIAEPIQFYSGRDHLLFEFVVWTVDKNKATGYLTTPKGAPILVDNSTAVGPVSPAATSITALLVIDTSPAVVASVYVDDQPRGITDSDGRLQVPDLSPGQHRLRLDHPNYRRYENTVDLVAGLNAKSVTLIPVMFSGPNMVTVQPGVSENGTTFEVLHHCGGTFGLLFKSATGSLRVSKQGLQFAEYGQRAHSDHDFKVSCTEVMEVKSTSFNPGPGWFRVRLRSKSYDFKPGSDWHQAPQDKADSEAIVAAIQAACGR